MKFSINKYLFAALVCSLGVLMAQCQPVTTSDESKSDGKQPSNDLEAYLAQTESAVSSEKQAQRYELIKALLEELLAAEDEDTVFYDESDENNSAKDKRAAGRSNALQKKDAQLRRQASRWDIGFGKRVPHNSKSKSFMDATYGKRNSLRLPYNARTYSYGRRQQWDLQYGK